MTDVDALLAEYDAKRFEDGVWPAYFVDQLAESLRKTRLHVCELADVLYPGMVKQRDDLASALRELQDERELYERVAKSADAYVGFAHEPDRTIAAACRALFENLEALRAHQAKQAEGKKEGGGDA